MRSAVSTLSFTRIGIPCNGPRGPLSLSSLSRASAIWNASGLSSMMLFIAGPCLSMLSIRSRYFSTSERALNLPDFIPACISVMVISSSSDEEGEDGTSVSGRIHTAKVPAIPVAKPDRRKSRRPFVAGLSDAGDLLMLAIFALRLGSKSILTRRNTATVNTRDLCGMLSQALRVASRQDNSAGSTTPSLPSWFTVSQ